MRLIKNCKKNKKKKKENKLETEKGEKEMLTMNENIHDSLSS